MQLQSPHLNESVSATPDNISELIFRLVGAEDPFAIVVKSELTYAQVLWAGTGFILEYQAGSIDQHFKSARTDFTAQEIVDILVAYANDSPDWSRAATFSPMDVPGPFSFRLGRLLGKMIGRTVAAVRPSSSGHG